MVEMEVRKVTKGVESNMVAFDFERTPITQIADYIIITASNNGTSDIHFDPREDGMMVRFRIDGDLQDYTYIPKLFERNLTTRLKLLANMNITESRLPQDGAIKGEFGGKYLDMRVSCLPLNTGEKIVIRILDYTRSLQGIDNLGFNQTNLKKIKRMMGVPNGIILITGATGSGKSTTVYSILQGLNRPEINIITVEDPIEMNIEGMNQVQVNAEIGMTFAAALRSILRQDPNVILIGEIRDSETAQIAVRASITGHLVLSTIHTNNSLATIERLLDMDVERYLMSTALTGIVSQRLGKQLCMSCRVERETTKYEKKVFKKFMNRDIEKIYDADPKGCENCRKGYKGRIAIHEVLELDDEIRNAINNPKLTKEELADMVYNGKTISMLQDALGKAISGLTSFEEVYRVIEMESDEEDDISYLTRSLDDDDDDEAPVELATDTLDEDAAKKKNTTGPIVEPLKAGEVEKKPETDATKQENKEAEKPKLDANGNVIRDVKDILKEQNVPTGPQTPAQAKPANASTPPIATTNVNPQAATTTPQQAQQPNTAPATLPQVATLTKEQQQAQAAAMAAKKAQEQQAQANKRPDTPPPMLTAEQAQAQQLAAKQQYLEQKNAEMEKKATDFLAKPDLSAELKKSKIVAKTPDITPIVLTPEQAKAQQEALKAKSQPQQKTTMPPQEQKPEKPQVLVKQAPPTVPQPEKIEKEIPELNISIKTDKDKALLPEISDSPIINEEENVFDEKDKVEAIDLNKISKSTDLEKNKKEVNDNPLLPTVKEEHRKHTGGPVIIDTFDADMDKSLLQKDIKKNIHKNEDHTANLTTPEITKLIDDQPLIINSKTIPTQDLIKKDEVLSTEKVTDKPLINPTTEVTAKEEKDIKVDKPTPEKVIDKPLIKPVIDDKAKEEKDIKVDKPTPEKVIDKPLIKPVIDDKAKDENDNKEKVVIKPVIKQDDKKEEKTEPNQDAPKIIVKPDGTKVLLKPTVKKLNDIDKEKFKIITKPDGTKVLLKPVIKSKDEQETTDKEQKTIEKQEKAKVLIKPDGTKVLVKPTMINKTTKKEIKVVPTSTEKVSIKDITPSNKTEKDETKEKKVLVKPIGITKAKDTSPTPKAKSHIEIKSIARKNDLDQITSEEDNKTIIIGENNNDNKEKETSKKESLTFNIPEIHQDIKPNDETPKENNSFITEMKSTTFDIPKVKTDGEREKDDESNTKSTTLELPKIKTKDEAKDENDDSKKEKKPFITEMKSTPLELPKIKTKDEAKDENDDSKKEKKPFITEMKSTPLELPKIKTKDEVKEEENDKETVSSNETATKNEIDIKESNKQEDEKETESKEDDNKTKISKPSINIFDDPIDPTKMRKPRTPITEEEKKEEIKIDSTDDSNLDLDIDGELMSLGED